MLVGVLLTLSHVPSQAFPPYRSTDADTAGAGTLEARLGLLRLQRRDSSSERTAPLTRVNLGIGEHYEVISELEYAPGDHRLEEGALGFKWARMEDGFGIGVETLVLLPVQSSQGGSGLESQFLTTFERERRQIHFNAGASYDPRGDQVVRGWRASLLVEFPRDTIEPGIELFVRDNNMTDTRVQAGVGVIKRLERFEIRSGLHFGLSDAAPDIEASLWFAWKWQIGPDALGSAARRPGD